MPITFRQATEDDVAAMAAIRARYSYDEGYWSARIGGYLKGTLSPQKALAERAAFLAVDGDVVVGFVAGHRTTRFACEGELEWIDVVLERRGLGIADGLIRVMAGWFAEMDLAKVCVNVAPENLAAVRLYARHGAVALNEYFMVWEDIRALLGDQA